MKVKAFYSVDMHKLAEQINSFIDSSKYINVIDIKYIASNPSEGLDYGINNELYAFVHYELVDKNAS